MWQSLVFFFPQLYYLSTSLYVYSFSINSGTLQKNFFFKFSFLESPSLQRLYLLCLANQTKDQIQPMKPLCYRKKQKQNLEFPCYVLPILYDWTHKHNYLENTWILLICMCGCVFQPQGSSSTQWVAASLTTNIEKGFFVSLQCLPSIQHSHLFWWIEQGFLSPLKTQSKYYLSGNILSSMENKANYSLQIIHSGNLRMGTWEWSWFCLRVFTC